MAQFPKVQVSFIRYIEASELAQSNSSLDQQVIQIGSQILVVRCTTAVYLVRGQPTAWQDSEVKSRMFLPKHQALRAVSAIFSIYRK